MKTLVVSATDMEIKPFMAQNEAVDILITGVGAPACMYALTKKLQQHKYDFIIQAGIAGAFKNAIKLGETVLVKNDVFADLGVMEKAYFSTLFEKDFVNENDRPYTKGLLTNHILPLNKLPVVNAITVNTVTDDPLFTNIMFDKFEPHIETMEGAAFHYVCLQEDIPFLQLRGVSNVVGERNKDNWNMQEAIENLNKNLLEVIAAL